MREGEACLEGKTTESIDHPMADLVGFEDTHGLYELKHLLNAFPVFAKPVVEIRTTGDLTVLYPPMRFVPGLGLLPAATIRRVILEQIGKILVEGWVIVLGNQDIVPPQADASVQTARVGYASHPR